MSIDPGTHVGRFRVVRLLAQGGMAEVYRAEQELAGGILRPCALKVIRPEYSESEDFREMFLDEARTACTLSHPNIVHIYEVGEADGLLFMAMELVSGESLANVGRALRERGQRFSDEGLLAIGAQTCSALEEVHRLSLPAQGQVNLVHRDVSPHNLLLSSGGALKLIDFGIAKALSNRNLTAAGITKGKAGYFSPEQAMGMPLDGRSDLFSLGVTLYKLASGSTPFDEHPAHAERHQALVAGRWADLEQVTPGLLPGFYGVVRRALKVRKEDRFASAGEMREALEAVAFEAGLPLGTASLAGYVQEHDGEISVTSTSLRAISGRYPRSRASSPSLPRQRSPRLRVALAGAAAFLLSAIAGLAFVWMRAPAPPPPLPPPAPVVAAHRDPPPPELPLEKMERAVETPPPPEPVAPKPHREPRIEEGEKPHAHAAPREAPIPAGEGQLRVGAQPDGVVTISGRRHGETPLNLKLHSGPYTVELARPDGKKGQCTVKVFPDKTTRLKYDFATDRCALDYL